MNRIENGTCTTNGLSTKTSQKFSDKLRPMKGKCLKNILIYLDCTNYNEIDIVHLHIQKHVSYKKLYKKYKYYVCRFTQN